MSLRFLLVDSGAGADAAAATDAATDAATGAEGCPEFPFVFFIITICGCGHHSCLRISLQAILLL